MFFKTDVLPCMLKDHALMKEFSSGSYTVWPPGSEYSLDRVVFSTVGPKGSIVYGYTIGEDRCDSAESRWLRIDYDTLTVHHKFDNGYTISEEISNTSVLNNDKLKMFGFSTLELQLLATLVHHVRIRANDVLQN